MKHNFTLFDVARQIGLSARVEMFEDRDRSVRYSRWLGQYRDRLAFALGWALSGGETKPEDGTVYLGQSPHWMIAKRYRTKDKASKVLFGGLTATRKLLKGKPVDNKPERGNISPYEREALGIIVCGSVESADHCRRVVSVGKPGGKAARLQFKYELARLRASQQ